MIYTFELYFDEFIKGKSVDETGNIWISGSEMSRKKLVLAIVMLGINSLVGTVLVYFQIVKPW